VTQALADVHFFAAARAAVGSSHLKVPGATLAEIIADLEHEHPEFRRVRPQCSFLVNEVAVHNDAFSAIVPPGARIDVLPPFAGGAQ